MAESLVVSPSSFQNKAKNAYLQMKNCSPKFRSVLRQKYRERVENNRFQFLSKLRHIDTENEISSESNTKECAQLNSNECKPFVLESLDAFQNSEDWNLDNELLIEETVQEELTQYENWLLQEYELMWNEDASKSNEVTIICPLCYSGHFEFSDCHKISCSTCSSSFTTQRSIREIENDIFSEVNKHKTQCSSDPAFVNVPAPWVCVSYDQVKSLIRLLTYWNIRNQLNLV